MATVLAFEAPGDYAYVKGDATDAYRSAGFNRRHDGPRAKIAHFSRELAFFPDSPFPFLVVLDRVSSLNADWPKKWLLHSINEPAFPDGVVLAVEVADHIVRYAADLTVLTRTELGGLDGKYQYDGKLFVKTLLPEAPVIRKVGGTGYRFWVDDPGKDYPLGFTEVAPWEENGNWRIEVSPPQPNLDDLFLHVLQPVDSAVAAPPAVERVEAGAMVGALLPGRVVLFARAADTPVAAAAYQTTATGNLVHLLAGLTPDGQYQVTMDGTPLPGSPFTATTQGTLRFESPGGGAFEVSRLGG
jgi:hypothetical protein